MTVERGRLLAVAAALAVAATVGSGGFTSVAADRGVSVAVADDGEAFLGVDTRDLSVDNGNHHVTLIDLTNRFPGEPTVESVRVHDTRIVEQRGPGAAGASNGNAIPNVRGVHGTTGDNLAIEGTVVCGNGGQSGGRDAPQAVVAVDFVVDAGEVTVEMTREVEITCAGQPPGETGATGPDASAATPG